jgi:multiple sugar transport system substrate-binding protein
MSAAPLPTPSVPKPAAPAARPTLAAGTPPQRLASAAGGSTSASPTPPPQPGSPKPPTAPALSTLAAKPPVSPVQGAPQPPKLPQPLPPTRPSLPPSPAAAAGAPPQSGSAPLPRPALPPAQPPQPKPPGSQPQPLAAAGAVGAVKPPAAAPGMPPTAPRPLPPSPQPQSAQVPAARPPGSPSPLPPSQPQAFRQPGAPLPTPPPVRPPGAPAPAVAAVPPAMPAGAKPGLPPQPPMKPPVAGAPPQPGTPGPVGPAAPAPIAPGVLPKPPGAPATPPPPASPAPATVKTGWRKWWPLMAAVGVVLLILGAVFMWFSGSSSTTSTTSTSTTKTTPKPAAKTETSTTTAKNVTLTYWGLWEPSELMLSLFKEYETANPGVKIEYIKQSHKEYRERLQTAVASGSGPDLFRFHASWTPMLRSELSSLPTSVMSVSEYQSTFYPVAYNQLQLSGQIVGIPLGYEGLTLFYNKDVFKTAGAQPPTTWAELRTLANQLTVRSGAQIQRGGAALGTATNVEHFSDILGLLMLQNGADLTAPNSAEARDALTFYTNFAKADKVWDESLPSSTVAFARGEAAMMLAPSWRAYEVMAINPELQFGMASVPKLSDTRMGWASYWAEGVSAQSKSKDEAWKLLKYLSSAPVMKKLYSEQAELRKVGVPYSRVDLAGELTTDPYIGGVLADAPSAKGWYLNSFTHDNGINDQIIKYYEDAVSAVLKGKTADEALKTVDQGTAQVLRQYGVTTSVR